MKIGFIGLGSLGTAIAENILNKRKQLFVYNRTASKAMPLVAMGATMCQSAREIARESDVVFSIVSDDHALEQITMGEGGIAENLKQAGVHVSMSTILPATATQLAAYHRAHGNNYLAAPVMGRPEAARARKLNFLVSGPTDIVESIKPFLKDLGGETIWEFGEEPAAANVAKLCSNFLIASAIESMAEGINLARQSGLDANAWMHMLTQTIFSAPVYVNYGRLLLDEIFKPAGFSMRLGLKDANLIVDQSRTVNAEMPFGKLMQQRLSECVQMGLGDHDWTAVALALKK